jgi:hypothetical protein
MKCSRIALLLALAVLGEVTVARATDDVATYPFSKAAVLRLIYEEVVRPAQWFDNAADWRDTDMSRDARDDASDSSADEGATSVTGSSAEDKPSGSNYNGYYGNDARTVEESDVEGNIDQSSATEEQIADDDGGESNALMQINVSRDADASKSAGQSNGEDDVDDMNGSENNVTPAADEPNDNDQQSAVRETLNREIETDGDAESFDFDGTEYVYCSSAEKFAASAEMAAACCSMVSKLRGWVASPADYWHMAVRNISERIAGIDWLAVLHGQPADGVGERGSSDNEEP